MSVLHLADGWASLAWAATWQLAALTLLAWLAERLLRLRQPRARHALWWFVLAAPLVLAPGRFALERRQAVVRVTAPAPAARVMAEMPRFAMTPLPPTREVRAVPALANAPPAPSGSKVRIVDALALAWLLGCALLALRLVMGHRRVRRMLADSRLVEHSGALELLRALCAEAGMRAQPALRSSCSVGTPVLYGLRRPVIVVPEGWVGTLAPDELRALLAHEVAHLKRRDALANLAQRVIEIALFFHPAAWLASRRITLAREELCDAWALSRGVDPAGYARWLTAAAERAYANGAAASLGVAERRFTLLRRVQAIMEVGNMKRMSRVVAIGLVAMLAICAASFAGVHLTGRDVRSTSPVIAGRTSVDWNPKTLSLSDLKQRARFTLLLPAHVPHGYRLARTQIVWVPGNTAYPGLPARQAVRLLYRQDGTDETFSIFESPHVPGVDVNENVYQVVGQGYFESNLSTGLILHRGTHSSVDFMMMSEFLSDDEIARVTGSFGPWNPGAWRRAVPGDLALSITLLTKDGAVTAHEPLLASVTLLNRANEGVEVVTTSRLEIHDATGSLVAATPRPRWSLDDRFSLWPLKPGESRTQMWIVSGLYQFTQPGLYTVRAQQLEPSREFPVLAEGSAWVRALPFDAVRLKARCDELFAPFVGKAKYGDLDVGVRAKALYTVRHDIALPYLQWMVREWDDRYAIRAMRRIGTPSAQALVKSLAARSDRVGRVARQGLKVPLEMSTWDVGAY